MSYSITIRRQIVGRLRALNTWMPSTGERDREIKERRLPSRRVKCDGWEPVTPCVLRRTRCASSIPKR